MAKPAVRVDNLSKQYRLGVIGSGRLHEDVNRWWAKFRGKPDPYLQVGMEGQSQLKGQEFWALRDVSFDIQPGEVVGIIGRNGAGKSTLLKILSRITAPTQGRVEVRGRLASLLEVGTGFHPELTGRENIYLNGAILGMSKVEITKKFDEIVAFAEIEKFIDTPVKRYSSGMYVRLAFSVAAHLDADILLVDEVLAVGDAQFQKKCLGKMQDVSGEGRTVLFVSHNMGMINELCTRCILMDGGTVRSSGFPVDVINTYFLGEIDSQSWLFQGGLSATIRIDGIAINGNLGKASVQIRPSEPIHIEVRGYSSIDYSDVKFALTISTQGLRLVTLNDVDEFAELPQGGFILRFVIPPYFLRPGDYFIGVGADREKVGAWFFGDNLCKMMVGEEWDCKFQKNRKGLVNLTSEQVLGSRNGVVCKNSRYIMTDYTPGKPIFPMLLHIGRPNIGSRTRFQERVETMFDNVWLTNNGPFVQELEQKLADYLGVKHCILTCNGTIALELAIRAADFGGGEVILPSMTFVATAHALQWQEIKPVFCDIDPQTYCIDPVEIERHITSNTTGIIGVHLYGRPCAIDVLTELCQQHALKLIFDAAHAFGSSYKGKMIGNFGNCEVFSFHATKVFNTFEGGAVTTNDDELAAKIRLMKNFGFAGEDNVVYLGSNGKMPEICAAMGLTNLESLHDFIAVNKRNLDAYRRGLEGVSGITLIEYDENEQNNYHYIILEVDEQKFGVSRDLLQQALRQDNVLARRYFYPGCHRMEPYRTLYPDAGKFLKQSEDFSGRVLAMPNGTQISVEQIALICNKIRHIQRYGAA